MIEPNDIYFKNGEESILKQSTIKGSWIYSQGDIISQKTRYLNYKNLKGKILYKTIKRFNVDNDENLIVWTVETWQNGHDENGFCKIILTETDILNSYSLLTIEGLVL